MSSKRGAVPKITFWLRGFCWAYLIVFFLGIKLIGFLGVVSWGIWSLFAVLLQRFQS